MTDESLDTLMQRKMEEMMKESALDKRLKALVEQIRKTEEFRNFWAIRSQVQNNPAVWGLIKSFEIQKKKLAAPKVHPVEIQRLQILAQQIARNMDALAYYKCLKELSKIFRSIHLRISDKIGFRFATRLA
ncbi:MAG: YlbF family regulator [Candidatus Hodarchaeota archaeon]